MPIAIDKVPMFARNPERNDQFLPTPLFTLFALSGSASSANIIVEFAIIDVTFKGIGKMPDMLANFTTGYLTGNTSRNWLTIKGKLIPYKEFYNHNLL